MGYPAHLADGFAREDVMYSLIMLTIACAAAINRLLRDVRASSRRNGTIADREMQRRPGRAEPNRNQHR
jgi:hypothetical protein